MSNKAITWAWDQQLPPREKLILICLADAANDEDWQCWPSQRHVAAKTGYSIATVKRSLKTLDETGYLTRDHRRRADGSRSSDVYTLNTTRVQPDTTPAQPDTTPAQPDTGGWYQAELPPRSLMTYQEPSNEPSVEPKGNRGGRASAPDAAKGTRLPEDWMPPAEVIEQMRTECPGVDLEAEHRRFVDYWLGVPGAKGRKVRWDTTWRNWIRRANEDARRGQRLTASERNLQRGAQIAARMAQRETDHRNPFELEGGAA